MAIRALSLGDKQFLFRYYALALQNAGDKIGYVSSIKSHNYKRLFLWFTALEDFDPKSRVIPSIASNYYGAISEPEKLKYVIDYLIINGSKNPEQNWRSLTYAAYLASNINDYNSIVKATDPLTKTTSNKIPMWARVIGVFYLQNFIKSGNTNELEAVCKSWFFLQSLEKDILEKKFMESQLQKDPIFSSIIFSRIQKVKQNTHNLSRCS
jgi:hypothetical protein